MRKAKDARGGPGAVVIGGDYIALGVVRSLGRRGIPVWLVRDIHGSAAASRYVRCRLSWPVDDAARLETLLQLCRRYHPDKCVLYSTDDEAAALVARHHQTLSEYFLLTTPPWKVMEWAYDKRQHLFVAPAQADSGPICRQTYSPHVRLLVGCGFGYTYLLSDFKPKLVARLKTINCS
jgi:D-aspartate ligase